MTRREAREIALDRRLSKIDATAKDNGHTLEPWNVERDDGVSRAGTRCGTCAATAAIRIEDAEKETVEWEAGHLRWARCLAA